MTRTELARVEKVAAAAEVEAKRLDAALAALDDEAMDEEHMTAAEIDAASAEWNDRREALEARQAAAEELANRLRSAIDDYLEAQE